MSNKNGFTLVSDYLTWKYQDRALADVYAKVERFCLMGKTPYCHASKETIAEELSCSEGTVKSKVKILIEDGYLEDLDPQLRNKTHRLITTEKLEGEENGFWKFAEVFRKDKDASYFDCFRIYAESNKIEPFQTIVSKLKKPRGRIKGSIIAERAVNRYPLVGHVKYPISIPKISRQTQGC